MGSLEEVHMPQNGINHSGITALATALQHNTGLRILNLNDNTFTEKGAIAMSQVSLPHTSFFYEQWNATTSCKTLTQAYSHLL